MGKQQSYPTGVRPREQSIQIKFRPKGYADYVYEALPWQPTPANIAKAGRLRKDIVDEIRHGTFVYSDHFPDSPHAGHITGGTFADYGQKWLDNPENDWKPQSRRKYLGVINRVWVPQLGDTDIRRIRYAQLNEALTVAVKHFKSVNNKEPSKKLYNDWMTCIRGPFEMAVRERTINPAQNPTLEFKNKKIKKSIPDPFDMEEADLIIADAYELYGDIWGAWFEIGFYTGMRYPSEPSVLLWADIDLRKSEMRVDKILTKVGIQHSTKTNKDRIVELNSQALGALKKLRTHTQLQDSYIFIENGRSVISAEPQRNMWKFILKRNGIRYRDMYNMRHTYATFGLISGMNPAYMAEQLGHSVEEFFKTYAKWINAGHNTIQQELMEKALQRKKDATKKQSGAKPGQIKS